MGGAPVELDVALLVAPCALVVVACALVTVTPEDAAVLDVAPTAALELATAVLVAAARVVLPFPALAAPPLATVT